MQRALEYCLRSSSAASRQSLDTSLGNEVREAVAEGSAIDRTKRTQPSYVATISRQKKASKKPMRDEYPARDRARDRDRWRL